MSANGLVQLPCPGSSERGLPAMQADGFTPDPRHGTCPYCNSIVRAKYGYLSVHIRDGSTPKEGGYPDVPFP